MLCSLNWVERMASSRRISRGFHRLAILLAAIPLLIGGTIAILESYDALISASRKHQTLECAYSAKQKDSEQFWRWYFEATTVTAFLKRLAVPTLAMTQWLSTRSAKFPISTGFVL